MLHITPSLTLDESEITLEYVRSAGPGGQNVNKVASAAQLRFDVRASPSLPEDVKTRLIKQAGKRINTDGVLVLTARRYRTQEQNRQDAIQRLVKLIEKAASRPQTRKATRPSASAKAARLDAKKRRSQVKRTRRQPTEGLE
jgi:ribosome-associated protein